MIMSTWSTFLFLYWFSLPEQLLAAAAAARSMSNDWVFSASRSSACRCLYSMKEEEEEEKEEEEGGRKCQSCSLLAVIQNDTFDSLHYYYTARNIQLLYTWYSRAVLHACKRKKCKKYPLLLPNLTPLKRIRLQPAFGNYIPYITKNIYCMPVTKRTEQQPVYRTYAAISPMYSYVCSYLCIYYSTYASPFLTAVRGDYPTSILK